MFKKMKHLKNQKGLTLIELLAVIVILAIIAAIAIPAIGNIIENSRYKAVKSDAINVINAANIYFTENPGQSAVDVSTLQTQGFLDNRGKIPTTVDVYSPNNAANTKTELVIDGTSEAYSGTLTIDFDYATVAEINAAANGTATIGTTTP